MMYNNLRTSRGFTLLEVMVVLAILSIVTAIGIPNFRGHMHQMRLESAALQMVADIRYLQQLAMAKEEETSNYYITFTPGLNRYRLHRNTPAFKIVDLPPGVNLESTNFENHRLRINIRGLPPTGGTVILYSEGAKKHKYVVVSTITGRVRVSDTPP